jgi:beta-galactosidase
MGGDHLRYLAGWPDDATFDGIIGGLCDAAGIATLRLPDGLRVRDTATTRFFFNYGPKPVTWKDTIIPAAGVHWEAL